MAQVRAVTGFALVPRLVPTLGGLEREVVTLQPFADRVVTAACPVGDLLDGEPLRTTLRQPDRILVGRSTVDQQVALPGHLGGVADSGEARRFTHRRPAALGQEPVVLGERQLLAVVERQAINRLHPFVEHIADPTVAKLAGRLVEDPHSHSPETPSCIAKAVPARKTAANGSPADAQLPRDRPLAAPGRGELAHAAALLVARSVTVDLALLPHADDLINRLAHVRMAVHIHERHFGIPGQAADAVPEPFPRHENRTADVKAKGIVLEGRAVPVSHQEADQPLVGFLHDELAAGEADAGTVHHGEVIRHRIVEPNETVVQDLNRLV